ncbi:cysteine-rich VLP domain-containing protein [Merdimmobilis hominis]|uniref:cysteine-rich VLP domain-containing protein n=1 Tax=Merdimmobilis hominis TaxID=2897707 RepID=UPI001FAF65AE|nr:cysteine-rich VLP domain-containing protein [Merdimmobilis hominis]
MKITPKQVEKVHRLVRKLCANCDEDGNCILLDDGEAHRCVQLISIYGNCELRSLTVQVTENRRIPPTVCVLHRNKQGLCVPKSQSKAADFLAALLFGGLPPPQSPRKGEMILWGKIYELPCVSRQKKKRKYSQKPESAGFQQLNM